MLFYSAPKCRLWSLDHAIELLLEYLDGDDISTATLSLPMHGNLQSLGGLKMALRG